MLPTQIDRYQIIEECGRGGMAIVYRAYDTQRQMEVALKVLPREYLHDDQFRARFKREIDINTSFRHEGVVPIYGYGQFQGQLYLVMRYLPGGSLDDRLKTGQPQSLEEMIKIVNRVGPALDAAHQQGIIHRDLKPSNLLFDENGAAYIADFGIARLQEAASFTMLTANAVIGSPAYMSPEQAKSGTDVDGRSDIYSLGIVVFEAITGHLPFYDDNPMQLAVMQMHNPVPDILSFNPNLPGSCRDFIYTVLAKNPEDRFQSASEMAQALADVFRSSGRPSSSRVSPTPNRGQPSPAPLPRGQNSPPPSQGSPSPRGVQPPAVSSPPQSPSLPPAISPRSLPASARPVSKYLQLPPMFRAPSIPYITLPTFLHPITRFMGLPSTIHVPRSNLSKVITVAAILFVLFFIFVMCVGVFYLLFRFVILPSGIIPPLNSSIPFLQVLFG